MIKKYKLTRNDLKHAFAKKAGHSAAASKGAKKTKRVSSQTGKKAPVKFEDGNGNAWTGRGRTPRWLQAAEKAGAQRSSFAVQ